MCQSAQIFQYFLFFCCLLKFFGYTENHFHNIIFSTINRLSCKFIQILMKINKFCFKFMPINLTTFHSNKFLVFLLNFHIHATSLNFYNSFFNLFITKWTPNFLQFITNFFVTINFMLLNEIFFISMRRQLVSY